MDDTSNIIKQFEDILKKNTKKEPPAIYKIQGSANLNNIRGQTSTSIQDVLSKVSMQIKAIQKADIPNTLRKDRKKLEQARKSTIQCFNMLPRDTEVPNKVAAMKFETQFVLDTQLIDIIDNAEALVDNNGITQEFDSIFSQTDIIKSDIDKENTHLPDNNSIKEETEPSTSEVNTLFTHSKEVKRLSNSEAINVQTNTNKNTQSDKTTVFENNLENTATDTQVYDNCTEIINKCTEIETNLNVNISPEDNIDELDEDIQPSLVFKAKKSKTPSPMVFDLNTFEDFERIAAPILEENADLNSAKQLINSQIIGRELLIQTDIPSKLSQTKEQTSPILQASSERLKVTKTEHTKIDLKDHINKDHSPNEKSKESEETFLKDEILFSSDEENEYLHKEFQDIPLTCALETSFYEQPDVLDKTMYVGFQTASNRSIQISTESFSKAQSLLDDLDQDLPSKVTLTDLVDSLSVKNNTKDTSQTKTNPKQTNTVDFEDTDKFGMNDFLDKEIERLKRPDKRKFEGFMTANRKKIKLSDMALARCKRVFQDIDLDENYENSKEDIDLESDYLKEINLDNICDENKNPVEFNVEVNPQIDDDILQEFANDMSLINETNETHKNNEIPISNTTTKRFFDGIDLSDRILDDNNTTKSKSSYINENADKIHSDSNQAFIGFKTANNKQIKISSKALENAKTLFQDIQEEKTIINTGRVKNNSTLDIEDLNLPSTSKGFGSFKTASNKCIRVSNDALTRSKSILQDIISNVCEENPKNIGVFIKQDNTESANKLSDDDLKSTNSVKNVEIVDSNIKPDIDMKELEDLNEVFNTELLDIEKEHIPEICTFKTATNKPVIISEKALSHSKNIFKDLKIDEDLNDTDDNFESVDLLQKSKTESNLKTKTTYKMSNSFENIKNNSSQNVLNTVLTKPLAIGFQTASNKPIKISNEAIMKSKALFQDIENDKIDLITDKKLNDKETQFKGFQTGRNKPISISHKALSKGKEMFNIIDTEFNFNHNQFNEYSKSTTDNTKQVNIDNLTLMDKEHNKETFKGFQTANKKPIKISDEALAKSKAIFKDDDSKKVPTFVGFQRASKKPVAISAQALAKSKELFKDIQDEDTNIIGKDNNMEKFTFKGFQTASNKAVKISAEALAKSKDIFKDIDKEDGIGKDDIINTNSKFEGFQTASKKPVKISADALAKSKSLFKDIDQLDFKEENNVKTSRESINTLKGFQTASKKPVHVSDEALAKSKVLFKDIDQLDVAEVISNKESTTLFKGFQTASKKPVQISDEAFAKSKALFKDIDHLDIEEVTNKDTKNFAYKGFQTASKKPVQISANALAKSKALFKDIDILDIEENTNERDIPTFKGFQTASNKPVLISEEALAKSKDIFKAIDSETCSEPNKVKSSKFQGFQTANNKAVKVTDEALARSKRIFDDIDSYDENEEIKNNTFKGFETASKKKVKISEESLLKSKNDDYKENIDNTDSFKRLHIEKSRQLTDLKPKNVHKDTKMIITKTLKEDNHLEKLIDTQILNNFEETLHSEDFIKDTTPKQSKRSGSPILSCPKAKKRKFNTPYRTDGITSIANVKIVPKYEDIIIFDDYKKSKRYNLKDLAKVEDSNKKLVPDPYILNFNLDNILNFEFLDQRNDITDGTLKIEDLKEYFLKIVNEKLIPMGWMDNHLKLILWKLLSYEVKFTYTLNRVCTAKNVVQQLKYRYDKELYNVERPILRKILEKDDVASKMMVLCVAGIFVDGVSVSSVTNPSSAVELQLTDGWYFVKAVIDKMLTKLVYDGKITVGCKIVTHGAELMNCEQGIAPWEDTSLARLKIFGNSTRRARWDARLGCHGNAAILSPLTAVRPEGGKVSKLRLYVTRVYPMLYVEKFEDGSTVTRSERLENIHQIKYESDRQTAMEKLYEEVEKELSDQESQDSVESQHKNPKHFGSMITESQTRSLEEKSSRRREKLLQNIQERVTKKLEERGLYVGRNVVTLLKIRVAGVEEKSERVVVTKGFMSIWKPNHMMTEIVKENSWIEVMNVVPTAIRYSEIHLSAGRQSLFKQSKYKENDKIKPYLRTMDRKFYPVGDLAKNPTMTTDYNEIDTVGFIFQIDDESSKQPFQNIYLSDGNTNIICINFWGGLRKFGFHNVLDTGQIVSCTNLQKRAGNTRKSIPQFRVTEFTYFTRTPKSLVARNMILELEKIISSLDKRKYCEECIYLKNNYANKSFIENVSPYRSNHLNLTKNKVFMDSPLAAKCEDNLNLTGLDFESSFRQTEPQELSPKSKERKKKVNEKIARLKLIGEPPPLSPMNIINKSKNAFKSYKSPLAQTSAATANKSADNSSFGRNNIQSSPIISLNRTYVKNVNPVKLNFSNVQDDSLNEVDHFAEEFDGSPPLSLE